MSRDEKKVLLGILVVTGVFSAAGIFGIHYTFSKINQEKQKISELRKKIKNARAKIAQIPKDERDVIILRENVQEYTRILPDKKEITEYARTLAHYSSQAGLALNMLKPDIRKPNKGGAFQQIRYSMRLQGTLWQMMNLLNMLENHPRFMQVKSLSLNAKTRGTGGMNAVHTIDMIVETYYYNKAPKGRKTVRIPLYERKKADLEEAIHSARSKFEEEHYTFKGQSGRRDIFVDPRLPSTTGEGKGRLPRTQQQMIVDACRKLLEEIQEIKRIIEGKGDGKGKPNIIRRFELTKEMQKRISVLSRKLKQIEDEGVISYAPLHSQLIKTVKEPLDRIIEGQKDRNGSSDYYSEAMLEKIARSMEEALEAGELELAIDRYKMAEVKIGPDDFGSKRRRLLVKRIKRLHAKAEIAMEFCKKDLKITGRIIRPDKLSLVIINGKSYYEGDLVEDDLFVKKLTRDSVEFLYKGVVISKKL